MRSLALLCLATALAAAEGWVVVPESSTVRFSGSSTLHDFAGIATLLPGRLRLDGAASAGALEADATTMTTAHAGRDAKLHGETMQTATFPRVRFDLTGFAATPDGGIATGWWTMHGVAREIAIPVTLVRDGQARATAAFTLDIRDWDVRPPRVVVISVDPTIAVTLDLALRADPAGAPPRMRRDLAGVVVVDAAGAPVDVGALRGRPLALFTDDGVDDAKRWCEQLAAKLPQEHAPLAVLDGRGLSDKARRKLLAKAPAGAALDAEGALAAKAQAPHRDCVVLAIAADGALAGLAVGAVSDAARDRIAGIAAAP